MLKNDTMHSEIWNYATLGVFGLLILQMGQ